MEKTCGNCNMYDKEKKECRYYFFDGEEDIHAQHEPTDKGCVDWEECSADIEQRYEQLEQAAREMYEHLHTPQLKSVYGRVLKALGVDV